MPERLVLWIPRKQESLTNDYTVGTGGPMCDSLIQIIDKLGRAGGSWSVARAECEPRKDVIIDPQLGRGWYRALHPIATEGFMPLEEAESRYLN